MASPKELHYAFKLGVNRVATQTNPDFKPGQIDSYLNQAQLDFIKDRIYPNNGTEGFETTQRRIDDLSILVIKYPRQPAIIPSVIAPGILEVDLTKTQFPYLYLINAYANVNVTEQCVSKIPLKFVQHDDFNETLRNPFQKDSREFIPYNFGRNSANTGPSMFIYSTQDVESIVIEYVKSPTRVSLGSYVSFDGITHPSNTFETSEHTHQEIVNMAVQLAMIDTQNPQQIQTRELKRALTSH